MLKFEYSLDTACEEDLRRFDYERATNRKPDPGTRVYRDQGDWATFRHWMMEMRSLYGGDLIPFEWVAEFVGVTRAAVHKKVKTGQLTVYAYGMEERVRGALGGVRQRMREEFKYALLTECHFWRYKLLNDERAKEEAQAEKQRSKKQKKSRKS